MGKPATARLGALTGLRFFAALGVAFAHLPDLHRHDSLSWVVKRMMTEGGAGVPFFFVLSGFVLAYAYHARLASPSRSTLRSYYVARVARIWPLHLLTFGLAIFLPVSPMHPEGFGPAIANAFLVHAWVPSLEYAQSYNSVTWTLSIEAFFYLVFPAVMLGLLRWRSAGATRLTLAAVLVWAAGMVWVMVVKKTTEGIATLYLANVCPAVRLGEFVVGMLLGMAFVRSRGLGEERPGPRAVLRWTMLEAAALVAVVVATAQSDRVNVLYRNYGYYTPVFAVVVAVFARERGWVSRLMASRIMVYLGDISFTLFMVHSFLFIHVGDRLGAAWGVWPRAALSLGSALLAAAVVHRLYEAPLRSAIPRWVGSSGERPARGSNAPLGVRPA